MNIDDMKKRLNALLQQTETKGDSRGSFDHRDRGYQSPQLDFNVAQKVPMRNIDNF